MDSRHSTFHWFATLAPTSVGVALIAFGLLLATGCEDPREITSADGEMGVIIDGNNELAVGLYDFAAQTEGNVFFSPFSINAALSMVYAGAETDTETQIADALLVDDEDAWHDNLGALLDDLSGEHHRPYTLHTANRVWGQEDVPLHDSFVGVMEEDYLAPVETEDFRTDAEGARNRINDWAKKETKGHIEELFRSGDMTTNTKLVLVNAIYFKADWENEFPKSETYDGSFTLADGSQVDTPLMRASEEHFPFYEDDEVQVIELPYKGEDLGMVVVLPTDEAGLPALESTLTAEQLTSWIEGTDAWTPEATVHLPSFEMDYELPLKEALQYLGMTDMFDENLADFSGIFTGEGLQGNVYVNAARHKAYVKVDEQGTTAAAATGMAMQDLAAAETVEFVADHPFLFLIRDRLTGAILFMGRIEDPRG
jgi:serpin B